MKNWIHRIAREPNQTVCDLLIIATPPPDTRTIARALAPARVNCRVFSDMRDALVDLFYAHYDLALIDLPLLSEPYRHIIEEIQHLAPWRRFALLVPPHTQPPSQPPFPCIAATDQRALGQLLKNALQARQTPGLQPEELSQLQHLFAVMRETVPSALKEKSTPGALDLFFSHLSQQLDLGLLGFASLHPDEPFILVQHPEDQPPEELAAIRNAILQRLDLIAPDTPRGSLDFQPRPRLSPPAEHTAFSLLPIVSDKQTIAWLIISMNAPDMLKPLLFSCLVEIVNAMTMIISTMQQLRSLALRDPLTRLYNRRYVEESAPRMLSLARRHGYNLALLFVDVDNFKQINDRRGHAAGDQALLHIANLLTERLRQSDMIARYAGDEFLVILPHTSALEAQRTALRLVDDIHTLPLAYQNERIPMSLSIGVALSALTGKPLTFQELLQRADDALRMAKTTGGNQAIAWNPDNHNGDNEASPAVILPEHSDEDAGKKPCILVVDDEISVLKYAERVIQKHDYHPVTCSSAEEAEQLLQKHPGMVSILLSDVNMPRKNGFELIRATQQIDPSIVAIIMSSDVDPARAILAFRNGAHDILQKPFTADQLAIALKRALEFHQTQEKNKHFQQELLNIINLKSAEHRRSLETVKNAFQYTLDTMVAMLDAREQYTSLHSMRVRDLTVLLARKIGFKPTAIKDIAQGALLHDIGKIGIADAILLKPDRLSPGERQIMEKHPAIGHDFLAPSDHLKQAAELVLAHHERWDGQGYPRRLAGKNIPVGARIFSLIDCYDAIRSQRVYKPSIPPEQALQLVQQDAGKHFDPEIAELFIQHIDEIEHAGKW